MKLGIDFGTSYTKMACWQNEQLLDLLGTGRMPSVATYVPDLDKLFFGVPAMEWDTEDNLSTRFFKLHLRRNREFVLGPFQLEALLYNFFSFLQQNYILPRGIYADHVNLSVPNNFGLKSRRMLINAAQRAFGVRKVTLLPEPLAALLGYNASHPHQPVTGDLLIVDVGGGTVDFSFISLSSDSHRILLESQFQVGQDAFSGSEVDRMVLNRLIAPAFKIQHGIELPGSVLNEGFVSNEERHWFYKWMQLAENIKMEMGSRETINLSVNNFYKDYNLTFSCSQADFAEAIKPAFDRLRRYWEEGVYERASVLGFAGSSGWNLDGILLLGGGSLTPGLPETIGRFCPGIPIIRPDMPDLYVIQGLSRWPDPSLAGQLKLKTIYPFHFYKEQKTNRGHELQRIPFDSSLLELDFAGRYEICSLVLNSPDNISDDLRTFMARIYEAAEEDPRPELHRFMDQEPVLELDIADQGGDPVLNVYLNLSDARLELDNNHLLSFENALDEDLFSKVRMKQQAAFDLLKTYKFMDEILLEDYARQLEHSQLETPEYTDRVDDSQITLLKLLSLMNIYGDN